MGGMVLPHHLVTPNPLQRTSYPRSFVLHRGLLLCSPGQSCPRSLCAAIIRSEANGVASPRAIRKHSKEELIAFFRDIQTSIAESKPKTSRRSKGSSDPFEEVESRKQSYGINGDSSGSNEVMREQRMKTSLDDMTVAELRELARARRMRRAS